MKKVIFSLALAVATLISAPIASAANAPTTEQTSNTSDLKEASQVVIIIIETPDEIIIIIAEVEPDNGPLLA